jgi:hypothetical protein
VSSPIVHAEQQPNPNKHHWTALNSRPKPRKPRKPRRQNRLKSQSKLTQKMTISLKTSSSQKQSQQSSKRNRQSRNQIRMCQSSRRGRKRQRNLTSMSTISLRRPLILDPTITILFHPRGSPPHEPDEELLRRRHTSIFQKTMSKGFVLYGRYDCNAVHTSDSRDMYESSLNGD